MGRPAEWRKEKHSYPMMAEMQTRFQDVDPNWHLNNVAFAALFENGRVKMHNDINAWDNRPNDERTMVIEVTINYLSEGYYPDPVEIYTGVGRTGNSSWTIIQAMFQRGKCIATCDSVAACRTDGEAKPLRAELRTALENILVKAPAG